jgi:multicomponent Na+:H+ antiporter subunit C
MTLSLQAVIYMLVGAGLFVLGVRALFMREAALMKIIAANIAATGVFLFLVTIAPRVPGAAADPVAQAMVLTGIVISLAMTAYALALLRRIFQETGEAKLQPDDEG